MFRCCQGATHSAEGQGEGGPIGDHALQQILSQCRIAIALREVAKFARRLSALETAASFEARIAPSIYSTNPASNDAMPESARLRQVGEESAPMYSGPENVCWPCR